MKYKQGDEVILTQDFYNEVSKIKMISPTQFITEGRKDCFMKPYYRTKEFDCVYEEHIERRVQ